MGQKHRFRLLAAWFRSVPLNGRRPAVSAQTYHNRSNESYGYSNEKIFFQSFFMLITVQFFFFASA